MALGLECPHDASVNIRLQTVLVARQTLLHADGEACSVGLGGMFVDNLVLGEGVVHRCLLVLHIGTLIVASEAHADVHLDAELVGEHILAHDAGEGGYLLVAREWLAVEVFQLVVLVAVEHVAQVVAHGIQSHADRP